MKIFIDEAGNLGKKDKYFVIAALVPEQDKRIKNIIKRACVQLCNEPGESLDEIKGSLLRFTERQKLLNNLNHKDDFSCFYIVADKNHIQSTLMRDNNLFFNYLFGHLLKRIINRTTKDSTIHIFLDNRTLKVASKNSLAEYIKIKAYTEWNFTGYLYFQYCDSKEVKALQMADVIANTVYRRYKYGKKQHHLYNLVGIKRLNFIHFPQNTFGK